MLATSLPTISLLSLLNSLSLYVEGIITAATALASSCSTVRQLETTGDGGHRGELGACDIMTVRRGLVSVRAPPKWHIP